MLSLRVWTDYGGIIGKQKILSSNGNFSELDSPPPTLDQGCLRFIKVHITPTHFTGGTESKKQQCSPICAYSEASPSMFNRLCPYVCLPRNKS